MKREAPLVPDSDASRETLHASRFLTVAAHTKRLFEGVKGGEISRKVVSGRSFIQQRIEGPIDHRSIEPRSRCVSTAVAGRMDVTPDRFVIDTNTVLYLLGGRLAQPLPEGRDVLSVVSELELPAYPGLTPDEEAHIKAFLQDMTIVELNNTVKSHAIDLRKRYRLKLPDAIIAATAVALHATLLTNDQRLLTLAAPPTQILTFK